MKDVLDTQTIPHYYIHDAGKHNTMRQVLPTADVRASIYFVPFHGCLLVGVLADLFDVFNDGLDLEDAHDKIMSTSTSNRYHQMTAER